MDIPASWQDLSVFPWSDPKEGSWIVTFGWQEVNGRMEPVGLLITKSEERTDRPEPSRTITAQGLRKIPIGSFIEQSRQGFARDLAVVADEYRQEGKPDAVWRIKDRRRRYEARTGRPRMYDRQHFEDVAQAYTDGLLYGSTPTKKIEKEFHVSHPTAARWVQECRKLGLLGPTDERKAGGVLSPRQKEVNEEGKGQKGQPPSKGRKKP